MKPTLCGATLPSETWSEPHRCLSKRDHVGPHSCDLDEHTHWDDDGFDSCCDAVWDSSPRQMRMGSWTIDQARPGDVIAARGWPKQRAIKIEYVGRLHIVGIDGRPVEVAIRKKDFDFVIIDMEDQ